jgi:2-dehydro-3-deoxygluconokinase
VDSAIDAADVGGATVSFDVNLRRRLWDDEHAAPVVGRLARRADIVLGAPDELVVAAGGTEPAKRLVDAGVGLVVTKAGADGAWSLDSAGTTRHAAAIAVPWPIDPVGAGDAFCAGFIAARLEDLDDGVALRWGAACGAAAVSVEGDVDGLPSRAELARLLESGGDQVR